MENIKQHKFIGLRVRYWPDIHDDSETDMGTVTAYDDKRRIFTVELDVHGTVHCGFIHLDILPQ